MQKYMQNVYIKLTGALLRSTITECIIIRMNIMKISKEKEYD